MRSALTRSPRTPSSAGARVSAASTETNATAIALTPSARSTVSGTSSRPDMASMKAMPLNTTARLAVAPDIAIASSLTRPPARSSR